MSAAWIKRRKLSSGTLRYEVRFRLRGRGPQLYAGRFKTRRDAEVRKRWVEGELAALRVPDTPPRPHAALRCAMRGAMPATVCLQPKRRARGAPAPSRRSPLAAAQAVFGGGGSDAECPCSHSPPSAPCAALPAPPR